MSASAFRTVAEEINRQRQTTAQLSRSASIGIDMTPSALNPIREVFFFLLLLYSFSLFFFFIIILIYYDRDKDVLYMVLYHSFLHLV